MNLYTLFLLYLSIVGVFSGDFLDVVVDFIVHQERPTSIISFVNDSPYITIRFGKSMTNTFKRVDNLNKIERELNILFIADLEETRTNNILIQAETKKLLRIPSRWLLFLNLEEYADESVNGTKVSKTTGSCAGSKESNVAGSKESNVTGSNGSNVTRSRESDVEGNFNIEAIDENIKLNVESNLKGVNISINSEVYVVIRTSTYRFYTVFRKSPTLPLVWEFYGEWRQKRDFIKYSSKNTLPMKRQRIDGLKVVASSVITNNFTISYFEDYLHREVDTIAKYTYHMMKHLLEWVNGSGEITVTDSWGYKQKDGRYNGIVREMEEGRAAVSGAPFIPTKDRIGIVEYVAIPGPMEGFFIFRKPALASVSNIFALPFDRGVWSCLVALVALSSMTLFLTSYREQYYFTAESGKSTGQRISDGFHDTLCLVFQQGTARDPISISARQILLLGLLSFMFLFTAYSANVVALLQTTTNEINSVDALLRSPLKMGLQDAVYARYFFPRDTRPANSALWRTRLQPQGEKAFLSIEEGIRKVREGMFAFHVEMTAGYDEMQRTFYEYEKCNIGEVKFIDITYPYVGVADNSPIKEQLKIGIRRIIESGVQSRSTKRIVSERPSCASVAMFAAVTLGDVAPAFKFLLITSAVSTLLLILELATVICK